MYMDILAAILVIFLAFLFIHNKKNPKKLFGVYSQAGKWYFLKYPLFLSLLHIRRMKFYFFGKEKCVKIEEFERRQPLSDHPLGFDAIFFHGISQDGVFLVAGAERRHQGVINSPIYIQHPEFGLLKSGKLPNTKLQEDPESMLSNIEWGVEGLKCAPIIPMKKWRVSFNGKMRLNGTEKMPEVNLELEFVSDLPWYYFDMELSAKMLARSVSRESWTKELFQSLKEAHQKRYEQMGSMEGKLTVDGKTVNLKLDAFRDHCWGKKRDWKLMHRYIFQMLYLENQTRIVLGLVSQPSTGSHLEIGYLVHPNGKIDNIESCDIRLWQHGENGKPSQELFYVFIAGKQTYECKTKSEIKQEHFIGNNIESKMYEIFGWCEVNGIKGKLISEWNYSNINGKFDLNQ